MKNVIQSTIILTVILFCFSCSKKEAVSSDILPVKTILASPKIYQNKEIRVVGNIYKLQETESKIQLVDLTECTSTCNPVNCKVLTLPVNYGALRIPDVGSNVIVSGKITKENGKFSFICTKVERYNEN